MKDTVNDIYKYRIETLNAKSTTIDVDEAVAFLKMLSTSGDGLKEKFTFQVVPERQNGKRHKARHFSGTFAEHCDKLAEANENGCGVFVMVNAGDLTGRRNNNVKQVRALFVDLDNAPINQVSECEFPPHVIVESSPNRYHAYWLVNNCSLERFPEFQRALAKKFGGDTAVCDLPRVMRLPGFLHLKETQWRTHIIELDDTLESYDIGELATGLDLAEHLRVDSPISKTRQNHATIRNIEKILEHIPADCNYGNWIKVGMAIHSEYPGAEGEQLFDKWSQGSKKYVPGEPLSKWKTFSTNGSTQPVTLGSLLHLAKENGYQAASASLPAEDTLKTGDYQKHILFVKDNYHDIRRDILDGEVYVQRHAGDTWHRIDDDLDCIRGLARPFSEEVNGKERKAYTLSAFKEYIAVLKNKELRPGFLIDIPEWDGVERIRSITDHIAAKDFSSQQVFEIVREWGAKAYLRAFNPEINQHFLVLTSNIQGKGKDSIIDALVGGWRQYFEPLNLNNDSTKNDRAMSQVIIASLPEFDKANFVM